MFANMAGQGVASPVMPGMPPVMPPVMPSAMPVMPPAMPVAPPVMPVAPPVMPVAAPPVHTMTAAAQGATYEQMTAGGWTDDLLVQHGMMLPPGGAPLSWTP